MEVTLPLDKKLVGATAIMDIVEKGKIPATAENLTQVIHTIVSYFVKPSQLASRYHKGMK
jgi:hypothetical protein